MKRRLLILSSMLLGSLYTLNAMASPPVSCEEMYSLTAPNHLTNVVFEGIVPQLPTGETRFEISSPSNNFNNFIVKISFPGKAPIITRGQCDDDQGGFGFLTVSSPGPTSILGPETGGGFAFNASQYIIGLDFDIRASNDRFDPTTLTANR